MPSVKLRGLNIKVHEGVSIVFKVMINQVVPMSAELKIVGSIDELGQWDPKKVSKETNKKPKKETFKKKEIQQKKNSKKKS